jgi:hypothetical protein
MGTKRQVQAQVVKVKIKDRKYRLNMIEIYPPAAADLRTVAKRCTGLLILPTPLILLLLLLLSPLPPLPLPLPFLLPPYITGYNTGGC